MIVIGEALLNFGIATDRSSHVQDLLHRPKAVARYSP
jgi:hypothetical protein